MEDLEYWFPLSKMRVLTVSLLYIVFSVHGSLTTLKVLNLRTLPQDNIYLDILPYEDLVILKVGIFATSG